MAERSIKAIKSRIKSVEGTMQITRAMELVSSSKLQKARVRAEAVIPVQDILIQTLSDISKDPRARESVFFKETDGKKSAYIIIAGDRGLAGGYNNNLFRAVDLHKNAAVLPIGKKALEYYKSRSFNLLSESYDTVSCVSPADCRKIAEDLTKRSISREISRIYIAYSKFSSVLVQEPVILPLIPIVSSLSETKKELTIYEPSPDEVLETAVIQYLSVYLYCALCESVAAEHAARRNAMSAANKNGAEMIDDMRLKYNRARQSVITQELNEIIGGAEAL